MTGTPAPGGGVGAKDRHVEVCLTQDVESTTTTGLEDYRLDGVHFTADGAQRVVADWMYDQLVDLERSTTSA